MSIITYPLNGVTYDAEDVSTYLCTRTSGVYSKDTNFAVSVTGPRQITVAPGLAWINYDDFKGVSACSREAVNLTIPDADSTLGRIDRVVLRFDTAANLTAVRLKPGTPAAAPEPPAILQNHNQYELGLCTVRVPAGSSVITAADITDTRADETVCGVMRDGVTGIPTAQITAQARAMLTSLQDEVDSKSFYTKAEADATTKALQTQISKAGGNVGQAIIVWSPVIDIPGYQQSYTIPDKVPDNVDFLVLLQRDTDLKFADDAQNIIIVRGQSVGKNGYNYSFAQDGTLSLALYNDPKTDFLYGFHYVTVKEGTMIPRAVKQGKVQYPNNYTPASFTVPANTDYIVFEFIASDSMKVGDNYITVKHPSSRTVLRGFTRNKDFTFASDGTVTVPLSLYSTYYNNALYTCYHYMTSEELSAQTAALVSAQSAQSDTDAMTVDQEYRLTLLELGINDADTDTTV